MIPKFNAYRAIWWKKVVTAWHAIQTRAYDAPRRLAILLVLRRAKQSESGLSQADKTRLLIDALKQEYIWRGSENKAIFEENGIQLVRGNYYSPIPTLKEIETSWELRDGAMPYLEPELYDNEFMLKFLNDCLGPYAQDFNPPLEATDNLAQFYWRNSAFSYSDALAYYCMIRYYRPQTIVEVGAGYSSFVAAQALRDNDAGDLILVEPYPSERLRLSIEHGFLLPGPQMVEKQVQDVPVSFFLDNLGENDILFIDSTHTTKCGGDCIYLYLKVLPRLKSGVVTHAHDIFLPQMMPAHWQKELNLYWTEQYLLQAYLLDNEKVKVLFGSHYHHLLNRSALESFMGGKYGAGGGSFWFQKRKQ